jgi:type VI secretion system secreted protein Hcp
MAYEFYVTIEGTKQGKFKGESPRAGHTAKLAGTWFKSSVVSPRDTATGAAAGKRRHEPLVFRKEVGAATPQIAQALCTNEVMKSVLFEFCATNAQGAEEVVFTIKLVNATISSQRILLPETKSDDVNVHLQEEIEFTFQRIEWESKLGKTMAVDDWTK